MALGLVSVVLLLLESVSSQNPAQIGDWVNIGCYSDNVSGRALTTGNLGLPSTTNEACTSACFSRGFRFSGTEFSAECYCGSAIVNGGAPASSSDCSMACAGNSTELCGGPNRLNVYNYTGTDLPSGGGTGGGTGGSTGAASPVLSGLPGTWKYAGCYVDNAFGRDFEVSEGGSPQNTVESCVATCDAANFTVAGMEFADECYCGNRLVNGATLGDETTCSMGCAGNASEACGGPNRLSVYSSTKTVTVLAPPKKPTTLPGHWTYEGCYVDSRDDRVLPWTIVSVDNTTVEGCLNQCVEYGYDAAGLEAGDECYCGDGTDITDSGTTLANDGDCNSICSGDPTELCGGGFRLQTYSWNATINTWNAPANTGRYELLIGGLMVPLIATLGINNKVTLLEKSGTSYTPNSTGAYELDLSLTSNFSAAWREMHVKTDVFCAASIILPDIGGRQINVGGWSEDSTFGIRFYTPDGVPGTNGTNDWEENWQELSLQIGRWYPTAAMLPNGSIVVIGGDSGSNAEPRPNLEILPKPPGGPTVVDLPWLNTPTAQYNLYPFVVVLPSGRLFVAYYNEARIIDSATFDTVEVLPPIPGAVGSTLGGRTYPLEGAAMVFPQHAPYTDPLRILLCGGSTGPGPAQPLDNCVSIEPEGDKKWTIERMPAGTRVMPEMAALPDGTFLIANGAHHGIAGFGLVPNLTDSPNLIALLYDPSQAVKARFSVLNETIVPRLYHSELSLLPDGRVLVSGSDPQTAPFPQEMRIEVYIPPYLTQGFIPPTFNIPETDWAYGGTYSITNVVLHQKGPLRVSLVFATSSTHGNAMGARTIFPAFSCQGTTCKITAPPNAFVSPPGWHQLFILDGPMPSHSAWVRIGGDPAKLGNWPNLPGFTPPGV
ncbi:hypothetical protein C8J56DRAFT_1137522 [Mycena floridula]|nr:hypothetical protein C8J56DRAFT_1137522 [Mycena floridula]